LVKDATGRVTEVHCTYDAATRSGSGPDSERKVKGTVHWVSARHGSITEVRLYDRLFKTPLPGATDDIESELNPDSLIVAAGAVLEPSLADAHAGERFQFERQGYFAVDPGKSASGGLVFNRVVTLRDSWAKTEHQAVQNQA
jgi:glutaminyl-tRNA synthetase